MYEKRKQESFKFLNNTPMTLFQIFCKHYRKYITYLTICDEYQLLLYTLIAKSTAFRVPYGYIQSVKNIYKLIEVDHDRPVVFEKMKMSRCCVWKKKFCAGNKMNSSHWPCVMRCAITAFPWKRSPLQIYEYYFIPHFVSYYSTLLYY